MSALDDAMSTVVARVFRSERECGGNSKDSWIISYRDITIKLG